MYVAHTHTYIYITLDDSGFNTPSSLPHFRPPQTDSTLLLKKQFTQFTHSESRTTDKLTSRESLAWFLMGLFNNISFVIMAASAKDILPGSVSIVYLANSFPSLLLRLSAPYWFDRVPVSSRMLACFCLFVTGFTLVAVIENDALKLVGVACISAQCGMGEMSMLALSTRYGNKSLTLWSSGTGAAGIFGYFYFVLLHRWIGLSSYLTLLGANAIAVAYYMTFLTFKVPPKYAAPVSSLSAAPKPLSFQERFKLTLSLWPWGVPLIVVYFAEYAMQSGTWSSIGFPVTDKDARAEFYQNANWCYQVGVLISRSSGTVWRPKLAVLWVMPLIQLCLLVFSTLNASSHWWYDNSLLASSVVVGLFGGAVYVNGFRLISEGVDPHHSELAMAAASVCSDIGTNFGELAGLFIQKWLYSQNGVTDDRRFF